MVFSYAYTFDDTYAAGKIKRLDFKKKKSIYIYIYMFKAILHNRTTGAGFYLCKDILILVAKRFYF